jgi:hypothetical protein
MQPYMLLCNTLYNSNYVYNSVFYRYIRAMAHHYFLSEFDQIHNYK